MWASCYPSAEMTMVGVSVHLLSQCPDECITFKCGLLNIMCILNIIVIYLFFFTLNAMNEH